MYSILSVTDVTVNLGVVVGNLFSAINKSHIFARSYLEFMANGVIKVTGFLIRFDANLFYLSVYMFYRNLLAHGQNIKML